jgi:hypothetical protein
MATKRIDKYEGWRYQIVHPDELKEALWLIDQGDFKDLNDYIDKLTIAEIKRMKREDAEKAKKLKLKKLQAKNNKAA